MFALAKEEAEYLESPLRNSLAGLVILSKTSRECCAEERRKKRPEITMIFKGLNLRKTKSLVVVFEFTLCHRDWPK